MRRASVRAAHGVRACSSRSTGLRGADALLTPKERDARKSGAGADEATLRIRRAQAARRQQLSELYDVAPPPGGSITGAHIDAKLAAMERSGEFKGLAGTGKPLPERVRTHFGDEDAMDRMMTRVMGENNIKPESLEIRSEYRPRLKAFRLRLEQQASTGSLDANVHAALLHEMSELQQLHAAFTSAAVKDSLTFNLPISVLPRLAPTLDEELASALRCIREVGERSG